MYIYICIYTKKAKHIEYIKCCIYVMFKSGPLGTTQPINMISFKEDHLSYFELSSFVSKSLGRGEASELFLILIVMFTNVVLINLLFGLSCWQDFIDIASNINRIHKLIAQFLNLWFSQSSRPVFSKFLWALGAGVLYIYIHWDKALEICILIAVIYNSFHLL